MASSEQPQCDPQRGAYVCNALDCMFRVYFEGRLGEHPECVAEERSHRHASARLAVVHFPELTHPQYRVLLNREDK